MGVSADYIEFACEILSGIGPVRARKMFGGAGLYADEVMFALIADDQIYIKVDDALAADLEGEGSGPFMYEREGAEPAAMGYWRLPEAALDDPDEATRWAHRALDVALKAKAKRR